jgi:hypothetical protein
MEIDPKFKKLWEEAQANQRRLIECKGPHEFVDLTPNKKIGKSFRCSLCNGEANGTDVYWYKMGLKHGRTQRSD